jgi:chromosome condensin MukBEF complex kleisin-like MukF subunit
MFAMVAIEDYTIVGVGNTLVETLMAYKNAYNMAGNKINPKNVTNKMLLKTVVNRIQSDTKNGNSFYYFTVAGMNNIFIGSSQISNEMPVTMAGDSIQISFDNDTNGLIDISAFKNMSLGQR